MTMALSISQTDLLKSPTQVIVLVASLVSAVVLIFYKSFFSGRRLKDEDGNPIPPGPIGLPILGMFFSFWHESPHPNFSQCQDPSHSLQTILNLLSTTGRRNSVLYTPYGSETSFSWSSPTLISSRTCLSPKARFSPRGKRCSWSRKLSSRAVVSLRRHTMTDGTFPRWLAFYLGPENIIIQEEASPPLDYLVKQTRGW